ncbi:hypothetical protein B0H14DRAFT_3138592 [Mycena olivaceomarginata]|nr:hypothetical protein B0H14DRAFT_3138592 [Mycena olivaceomarginata]
MIIEQSRLPKIVFPPSIFELSSGPRGGGTSCEDDCILSSRLGQGFGPQGKLHLSLIARAFTTAPLTFVAPSGRVTIVFPSPPSSWTTLDQPPVLFWQVFGKSQFIATTAAWAAAKTEPPLRSGLMCPWAVDRISKRNLVTTRVPGEWAGRPKGIQYYCVTRETLQEQQAIFSRNCCQALAKVPAEQTKTHAQQCVRTSWRNYMKGRGEEEKKEGGRDGWIDRIYSFMEGVRTPGDKVRPQALIHLYGAEHDVRCIVGSAMQVEQDVAARECVRIAKQERKTDAKARDIRSSAGVVQDVVQRSAMQFLFRRKGGGWARIAAGMVGGGKEEANGAAADGSFERYKSTDVGKRLSWPESRGSPNRTDEG